MLAIAIALGISSLAIIAANRGAPRPVRVKAKNSR